jgi:hypothetical protein
MRRWPRPRRALAPGLTSTTRNASTRASAIARRKLDTMIAWEFGMLLADKLIGHMVPVRFALFAMIGALGLLVHLTTLWISLKLFGLGFAVAQSVATAVAMTSNFFFNTRAALGGWPAWREPSSARFGISRCPLSSLGVGKPV